MNAEKTIANNATEHCRDQFRNLLSTQYNFRTADKNEREQLIDYAVYRKFDEGSYLFYVGEPLKYLFFILDGAVHLHSFRKDESLQRWANVTGGNMISAFELFNSDKLHHESAQCLKDTLVAMIPVEDFFNTIIKLSSIAKALMEYMAFVIEERTKELLCVTVRDKIQLYFKRQMIFFNRYEKVDGVIKLFKDHYYDQIAEICGYARETVNRELKKLEKEGKIQLTKTHIIISDPTFIN